MKSLVSKQLSSTFDAFQQRRKNYYDASNTGTVISQKKKI